MTIIGFPLTLIALIGLSIGIGSCIHPRQSLLVDTVPQGASCTINRDGTRATQKISETPNVAHVKVPWKDHQRLTVICKKEGFQTGSQSLPATASRWPDQIRITLHER